MLTRVLRTFGYGYLAVVLAIYLEQVGLSSLQIGLVLTGAIAGSAVMTVFRSLVADRYGRRKTVASMALLMVVGGLLFALSDNFWLLLGASRAPSAPPAPRSGRSSLSSRRSCRRPRRTSVAPGCSPSTIRSATWPAPGGPVHGHRRSHGSGWACRGRTRTGRSSARQDRRGKPTEPQTPEQRARPGVTAA